MIVYPNAKINLGLYVTEKRADGFHNIESVFHPIPLYDILEVNPSDELAFASTGIDIPGEMSTNLCVKAYKLIKEDYDIPSVSIHLHKQIPIGAGLGGGSADASFMLKALNELFKLNITIEQLENYARKLGSDCAFFIENKPKYCFGKGDEFLPTSIDLSQYQIALVNPNIHVSTQLAYSGVSPKPLEFDLKERLSIEKVKDYKDFLKNNFEDSVCVEYPQINCIKKQLYENGCVYASMSGSGSTVFGIFENKVDIARIFPTYWNSWLN